MTGTAVTANPAFLLCDAIAEAQAALAEHAGAGGTLSANVAIMRTLLAVENETVRAALQAPLPQTQAIAVLRDALARAQEALAEYAAPTSDDSMAGKTVAVLRATLDNDEMTAALTALGRFPKE
jgi:hypothetical protein